MKLFFTAILLTLSLITPTPQPTDADIAARVLKAVNEARVANGLPPYALNPLLTQAATVHSQYMMDTGEVVHTGPGDTTALERVGATGYPYLRVNENIFAGMRSAEEAVEWWLTNDEAHRHNVLHPDMREIGIGVVSNSEGWTYYTMDISAQPNTLPMFISSDATVTPFPNIVLTLTNETIFTGGTGRIGYVTQVMISSSPDFAGATVIPWVPYANWTLDISTGAGVKTVYVRYIDAAGRTADAMDSIVFDPHSSLTGTATPQVKVTGTVTTTATVTATASASPSPTVTETEIPTEIPATITPSPVPTETPTAAPTEIAEIATLAPILTEAPIAAAPTEVSMMQRLRPIFAVMLLTGIVTIIVGILVLMRGLRA
jgi:hypothetical protein